MEQTTASDFLFHLNQGSYQAALDIARELQLDTDVVYKTQWRKRCADKTPATWHAEDLDLLKNIRDDAWVVRTCLELVVDDWSLQQTILELGKQRVEANNSLIQAQHYFDRYIHRLETFIDLWPSLSATEASFGKQYQDFRDANLVAQAMEYARMENSVALRTLFSRHTDEIIAYRLAILSEIPETADPSNFDLPQVLDGQEAEWIVKDGWDEETRDTIEHESLAYPAHEYPTSADTIAQWYMDRCMAANRMGLCSQALEWARYAQAMGVADLKEQQKRLDWLCKYVYTSGNVTDHAGNLIDLDVFDRISSYEIMESLLQRTDASRIVDDMLGLVIPWLNQIKTRPRKHQMEDEEEDEEERPEMLLYRWLLDTAARHLDWICLVLEHSKPTLPDDERIIKDDLDLSRLALALCYTIEGDTHLLVRIFECLPVFDLWEIGDAQEGEEQVSSIASLGTQQSPLGLFLALQSVKYHGLTQMMDTLQNHLSSAEVLSRYHASVPLSYFLTTPSVESQRQLCIRMASQAAGGVEEGGKQFDSDNDWRELLDDMMRLRGVENDDVFGLLSRTEVFEIFFTSLLRNGRFRLAKDLMVGPGRDKTLDIGRAEQLVIEAEQEFFDNATSGNMYTGNLKLAMECLEILPPTDMVNEEMDLIRATHTLISEYHVMDRPGIELMPIQVRQSSNRLELVSKLINSRRGIYRQPEQVLDLARKLGYQYDMLAEVKVLAMLSSAALVDGDFDASYQLCCATVAKAASIQDKKRNNMDDIYQVAWQACFNLGKMDAYENYARRLDVLSMALTMSPVQYIGDVLDVWRQLAQEHPPTADTELSLVESEPIVESQEESGGWHSLLDSAKRHQWRLGGLLKGESDGTRKVRDIMGSWLFQG